MRVLVGFIGSRGGCWEIEQLEVDGIIGAMDFRLTAEEAAEVEAGGVA